jgi:hypothetical protein
VGRLVEPFPLGAASPRRPAAALAFPDAFADAVRAVPVAEAAAFLAAAFLAAPWRADDAFLGVAISPSDH